MERSRIFSAVVFDLGEVLATPIDLYEQLAAVTESEISDAKRAYWEGRDAYDRGGSLEEYWSAVARKLGHAKADEQLLKRLSHIDSTAWVSIRNDAREVLTDLRRKGMPVAVLSNAPVALGEVARQSDWADLVEQWFFSGDLRVAKPDARIYELVTQTLGFSTEEIVFFDDREANVTAAREAGWSAFLWSSGEVTRETLANLGIL